MKIDIKGRFSFPGGTHPPQSKNLTCESRIQPGPAVKQVAIMLSQHTGAICQPTVKKADLVQAGQKIGDSDAFVSAPVHSPISGKVKEISLQSHAVLGRSQAVIIEAKQPHRTLKIIHPKSRPLVNSQAVSTKKNTRSNRYARPYAREVLSVWVVRDFQRE